MDKNKLKSALQSAYQQELDQFPAEYELEQKYSFSRAFLTEMEDLIKYVNKTYVILFGYPVPRNTLVLILAVTIIIPIGWLYYLGKIDRSRARLILTVAELIIVSAFGVSISKATRSMTRTYKNAFSDMDEEDKYKQKELEFSMPVPPDGYTKSNEYRTVVSHMLEFKDNAGRIISYNRVDIHQGVLTRIDINNENISKLDINGLEAISFVKGTESNLVWADKQYRYHLKGNCPVDALIEMAKSI